MRPPTLASSLAFSTLLHIRLALARTTFYDANDYRLTFDPVEAWQLDGAQGAAVRTDGVQSAFLAFAFAGEQISLYGLSASTFTVAIDGQATASIETPSPADATQSTRVYLVNGLDQTFNHSLQLIVPQNAGSLMIERIGVSYALRNSTDSNLTPALLPLSSAGSPPTKSSSTTSRSRPTAKASSEPTTANPSTEDDGPDGGVVAGAVIGSLAALAAVVFVLLLCKRRRAAQRQSEKDTYPRKRQSVASSLFGGFGRPGYPQRGSAASPLAGSHLSHPYASSGPQGWATRLARASSWKRKAERLPETRKFYGVEDPTSTTSLPKQPPPTVPLPSVPLEATREMEQRWRTAGPALSPPPSRAEHYTVQVFGQALSDYSHDGDARARGFSNDASTPPPTARTLRNPFDTASTIVSGSHESRGSLSSAEGAHIQHAKPAATGLEAIQGSPIEMVHRDATPSGRPIPARSSSARDLVSTHRAGPDGATSTSFVPDQPVTLARKPTITCADDGTAAESTAQGTSPGANKVGPPERRVRHQSSAALIEETSNATHSTEQVHPQHRRHRSGRSSGSRSLAGEEDRPGFFAARDHVPRYSGARGDPRLPAGSDAQAVEIGRLQ